jgi:hypothetical protein
MQDNYHTFVLAVDFDSQLHDISYYHELLFVDTIRVFKGEEEYMEFLDSLPVSTLQEFLDKVTEKIRYLKNGKFIVFLLTLENDYEYGS